MSKTKTTSRVPKPEVAPTEEKPKKKDSDAKKAFRQVIANYKEQNPEKYALKKDELQAKLNSL